MSANNNLRVVFGKENVYHEEVRFSTVGFDHKHFPKNHNNTLKFNGNLGVIGLEHWTEKNPRNIDKMYQEGKTINFFYLEGRAEYEIEFYKTVEKISFIQKNQFVVNERYLYQINGKNDSKYLGQYKKGEGISETKCEIAQSDSKEDQEITRTKIVDELLYIFDSEGKRRKELIIDHKKFVFIQDPCFILYDCENKKELDLEIPENMKVKCIRIYKEWMIVGGKSKYGAFAIIHSTSGKLASLVEEDGPNFGEVDSIYVNDNIIAALFSGRETILKTYNYNFTQKEIDKANSCQIL